MIRTVLGDRWKDALVATSGRYALDYIALVAAVAAVGHVPLLYGVLLAYCVAQILSWLPFTPGGLGFVEAGLTGTSVLAGVNAADAVVATLAYRLVSYWLPLPAGLVAWSCTAAATEAASRRSPGNDRRHRKNGGNAAGACSLRRRGTLGYVDARTHHADHGASCGSHSRARKQRPCAGGRPDGRGGRRHGLLAANPDYNGGNGTDDALPPASTSRTWS